MAQGFLSFQEIKAAASRAAYSVLPVEAASTHPLPTKTEFGIVIQILYFSMAGLPPAPPRIGPVTHAMWLDGATARVLRFRAVTHDDLGFPDPLPEVPGALGDDVGETAVDPDDDDLSKSFVGELDRFEEISPDVWAAFAAGTTSVSAGTKSLVEEYYRLFLSLTYYKVAPYCTCGAPDFFAWMHAVLTAP